MSDTAPMDPRLLAVIEHDLADDRATNEVYGFYGRLVGLSGQHLTDYVVSYGTVLLVAGSKDNATRLLAICEYIDFVTECQDNQGRRLFKLLADPEFWHIKLADEVAWERQRQNDNRNPDITAPVRNRDGDACRYCAKVVNFKARKGKLAGTYDHRPPGQPGSAETSVVACGECNARRGNKPVPVADLELPLLPVPAKPYYHDYTVEWLRGHEALLTQHGMTPPAEKPDHHNLTPGRLAPGAQAAPGNGERRATSETPAIAAPTRERDEAAAGTAPTPARPAAPTRGRGPADPGRSKQIRSLDDHGSPGRVGTGRDGSVPDGSPPAPPAPAGPTKPTAQPGPSSRRRSRRGRRGGRGPSSTPRGES
ncbi:hypothetical protein ACFWE5_07240 [Cellulosimicrobium funkei]|uniref:hypothetical protein n=1 Tax=Cellulosimicrobium funkei TaxID=264251 RepID=UPI003659ADED